MSSICTMAHRGILTELLWHVHNDDVRALVCMSRSVGSLLRNMSSGGGYWHMLLKARLFPRVERMGIDNDVAALCLFAWTQRPMCVETISAGSTLAVVVRDDGFFDQFSVVRGRVCAFTKSFDRRCVQVSAGWSHSLALFDDGSVTVWSEESLLTETHQMMVPRGRRCVQVSAGSRHSLALLDNGLVRGWPCGGADDDEANCCVDETSIGCFVSASHRCVQVSAGTYYSLALLDNGQIVAAGDDANGQVSGAATAVPTGRRCIQVSAGGGHALALLDDGRVVGWGDDRDGQASGAAQAVPAGRRAVQISAGARHSLALLDNGRVVGWGYDCNGCVTGVMRAVRAGRRCVQLSAGFDNSLAMFDDGRVVGWGMQWGRATKIATGEKRRWN